MIKGSRDFWDWRNAQLEEAAAAGTVDEPVLWEEPQVMISELVNITASTTITHFASALNQPVPRAARSHSLFTPASPVHQNPRSRGGPLRSTPRRKGGMKPHDATMVEPDQRRRSIPNPGRLLQDHQVGTRTPCGQRSVRVADSATLQA